MTAPTLPEELTALDAELEDAIPCEVRQITDEGPDCPCEAGFIVRWRVECAYGKPLPGDPDSFLCGTHTAALSRGDYTVGMLCGACHCSIGRDVSHIVALIVPVPT